MTSTKPSLKQMLNRMTTGHTRLLEAIRDGRQLDARTQGEIHGYLKAGRTLAAWGVVRDGQITQDGLDLLDLVYATYQSPRVS